MELQIGLSPCPNDTFIFYALIKQRIETGTLRFVPSFHDIQELNDLALANRLPLCKISYQVYPLIAHRYRLLRSGGALGHHCGPLLVAREPMTVDRLRSAHVLIPGWHTTAHFLLNFYLPYEVPKSTRRFDEIAPAVASGLADAGVLIHENRFTYQQYGLTSLADLGQVWETNTGLPIPLGAIALRRDLPDETAVEVTHLIRRSIDYAHHHRAEVLKYCARYADDMQEEVMQQHIDLYVNQFSIDPGPLGEAAVAHFFAKSVQASDSDVFPPDYFVPA